MEFPSRSENGRHPARHLTKKSQINHTEMIPKYSSLPTTSSATEPSTISQQQNSVYSDSEEFSIEALKISGISSSHRSQSDGAKYLERKNLKIHFLLSLVIICSLLISTGSCRAMQTCSIVGHKYIIDISGCDLVAVAVNRCSGFCRSLSFLNVIDGTHHIHAKCCKMIEVEKIPVNVTCSEGLRVLEVTSARECACFDCSSQ